ncbi:MAG: hypothetical protein WC541_10785, partial [Dehalococcoidia bacterium]
MGIELRQKENTIGLIINGEELGEIYFPLRRGSEWVQPEKVETEQGDIRACFEGAELSDRLTVGKGLVKVERSWRIARKGSWQLGFGYSPSSTLEQWIVPSVMYDRNVMGTGRYPRGGVEAGWSFREDRIPVPSCSILHNGSNWQAVFTQPSPHESVLSSVKTYLKDGRPALEIRMPYCEEPHTYTEKGIIIGGLTAPTERLLKISRVPFDYSRTFYIAFGRCAHISEIYMHLAELALEEFADTGAGAQADWSEIAALKLNHLRFLLIDNEHMTAVKMGRGNGLFQSYYEYAAGSFLVRGLEAATIFARAGKDLADDKYTDIAGRIGEFFMAGALPNGLHRDCYSLKEKRWGGYLGVGTPPDLQEGANTRCNGEVMVNYLRLYRLLRDAGRERRD